MFVIGKAIKLIRNDVNIFFLINVDLVELLDGADFNYIVSDNLDDDIEKVDRLNVNLFISIHIWDDEYLKIKTRTKLMLIDDNNDI